MKIEFFDVVVERGGVPALDGVTLTLDSALGAVALLGGNGAGKSTLLEAVLGLVPVTAGKIVVDDIVAGPKTWRSLRAAIGLVFQDSDDQLFSPTVRDDVAFGPGNLNLPAGEVAARVEQALAMLDIAALADRDPARLSGGEKRRAALAGVLAMHPAALLLDEPTSMLDPRGARELADTLNTLSAFKVSATHDLVFARRTCAYGVILKGGKLRAQGELGRLLADEALLMECSLA